MTTAVKFEAINPDVASGIEELARDYAAAKAAEHELELVREYFLLALSKLPEGTMTVSLTEQAQLGFGRLKLQARADDNGALHFRAVEA